MLNVWTTEYNGQYQIIKREGVFAHLGISFLYFCFKEIRHKITTR